MLSNCVIICTASQAALKRRVWVRGIAFRQPVCWSHPQSFCSSSEEYWYLAYQSLNVEQMDGKWSPTGTEGLLPPVGTVPPPPTPTTCLCHLLLA